MSLRTFITNLVSTDWSRHNGVAFVLTNIAKKCSSHLGELSTILCYQLEKILASLSLRLNVQSIDQHILDADLNLSDRQVIIHEPFSGGSSLAFRAFLKIKRIAPLSTILLHSSRCCKQFRLADYLSNGAQGFISKNAPSLDTLTRLQLLPEVTSISPDDVKRSVIKKILQTRRFLAALVQ